MIKLLKDMMNSIQALKPMDLVDIGIIAIFIYLILIWFKKAKARYMFFGMVIVGLIYILARFFGLYLTTMAFQAFFAVALIMIVIIFQDDIRHFFERIGIWGVPRRHYLATSFVQEIDTLNKTLTELSRKKIGALIVIQGKDPLDRHLEAGISLDGLLNQVLLESIFDRHVPSHDGAVIVNRGRITKFGCYLPLSSNIKEIGRLGTRHAAALGLSERSDALCLVVSEEQGVISVAEESRIRQLKDIVETRSTLENYYRRKFPKKEKNIINSFLTENPLEKIIAVILACGLWFVFVGQRIEMIRRDFVIPLEYRNLAHDMIIKEPKSKEIIVTLSGTEQAFSLLIPKELKLSLDMAKIKEGENKFLISKDFLRSLTSGITMVKAEPDEIRIDVYRKITAVIPIELKTTGRLPQDFIIREIKILPKEVAVTFPSTIPREKISIATKPIDLKPITENTTIVPDLVIAPEIGFPDNKYPEVKVIIEVEKK